MTKKKSLVYYCTECGTESAKWQGQCPGCGAWNTMEEAPVTKTSTGKEKVIMPSELAKPTKMREIETENTPRLQTGIQELDRVLGGGIVAGSLVLVGGDPGIGKSTLLLQMCKHLSDKQEKVLYVSGEESLQQIKLRGDRIGEFSDSIFLLAETNITTIEGAIDQLQPKVAIIDSIQTMYDDAVDAAPGSMSQVREITGVLLRIAKKKGITIFIVGHVTKEGNVAGPRMLEHMVDTVLYFEGDRNAGFRILRAVKNRFGSTNEIGVFEMLETGLSEVNNPSKVMLAGRPLQTSGSVVVCSLEGTRPILLEIQALVCQTSFNLPRRTTVGLDYNRVNLLLAVLEKRAGMVLSGSDAYVNIAGGMRLDDPAADLGIVFALVSSFRNRPLDESMVVFGEVGLSGEVRGVSAAEQRVREAVKMGFRTCIMPKTNAEHLKSIEGIKVVGVSNISQALEYI